jgi:hypothetical protein
MVAKPRRAGVADLGVGLADLDVGLTWVANLGMLVWHEPKRCGSDSHVWPKVRWSNLRFNSHARRKALESVNHTKLNMLGSDSHARSQGAWV